MKLDITIYLTFFISIVVSQKVTISSDERWSLTDGIEFQMTYNDTYLNNTEGEKVKVEVLFIAKIPLESFFAVGFGDNLYSADVVMFRAFPSLDVFEVRDMHFSKDKPPKADE